MNSAIVLTPRRLLLLGIFGLLAVFTYGFAASNNVDPSNAGDGSAAISGYDVTGVHYTLDATDPSSVTSVSFDISPALPATGTARISLNGGTSWLAAGSCSGTTTVSCTVSGVTVLSLSNLRVVAAQ